jgi:23S rRNA pseudouridine1911/1915/1917 synthase
MRMYEFLIGQAEQGLRLDQYLDRRLPDLVSRTVIQRAIREGCVTVGGRAVKAHHKLRAGEQVVAKMAQLPSPGQDTPLIAQDIPLTVIHEDQDVLVVDKPAGLVTHPAPGHWDGTLVNAILWHLGQRPAAGKAEKRGQTPFLPREEMPRAGIVHRLDKDTSGLLLVAKTGAALVSLARQLKARTMRRTYLALIDGHVPLNVGTIDAALGRHAVHRKLITIRHLGGRRAVTHYRVLKRFPRPFPYTLVVVKLETGRTHQIRVHFAHLGYPVIGDAAYGKRPAGFWLEHGVKRQMLHAFKLRFQHPRTGAGMELQAALPADFSAWLDSESQARAELVE